MLMSGFKFSSPKLVKLNFQINNGYLEEKEHDSKAELGISILPNIKKTNNTEAIVELNIEIGEQSNLAPFFVNLLMSAKFKLDSAIAGTDFDKLLEVNAPALLLSYARPIISSVTNQAGIKPLNLPFINFTSN